MNLRDLSDADLTDRYLRCRKQTKHDKRGRGLALSTDLRKAKVECLALKDEMARRDLLPEDGEVQVETSTPDTAEVPDQTVIHADFRSVVDQVSGPVVTVVSGPGRTEVA